jgi:O-antigen/teichoic acid export membrane protein
MGMKRAVARNAVWNWAGIAANMLVGFVVSPFLLHSLGETGFSLWFLIGSFTGYFGLLDLGIRSSVGRFIAFHRAKDDLAGVNETLSTALALLCGSMVIGLLGTFGLVLFFFRFFGHGVPADQVADTRLALLIAGANLSLCLPLMLFDATLWAFERFDVLNAIDITATVVRTGLTFALVGTGHGLVALAVIVCLAGLASSVAKVVCSFRLEPRLRIGSSYVRRQRVGTLWGFGVWRFVLSVSRMAGSQVAPFAIGAWVSVDLAGTYSFASRLIGYAGALIYAGTDVVSPVTAAYHAEGKQSQQQRLFLEGGKFGLALSLFFCIYFLFLGGSFLRLWVAKPGVAATASVLLVILAAGEVLPMAQSITVSVLLGMARHQVLTWMSLLDNVIAFTTAYAVVQLSGGDEVRGLEGVCWAVAASGAVCRGVCYLLCGCRLADVPVAQYLTRSVLPALAAAVVPAAGVAALTHWRLPASWLELIAYTGAYTVCYAAGCVVLVVGCDRLWRKTAEVLAGGLGLRPDRGAALRGGVSSDGEPGVVAPQDSLTE